MVPHGQRREDGMADSPSTRLTEALREANAPPDLIRKAEAGYYGDFTSPLATPIMQLVEDCRIHGLVALVERAMGGEFDG